MINLRKLVALDMLLHGTRFILAEFALGILLPLLLAWYSIRAGLLNQAVYGLEAILSIWLLGIAANYIPLFLYAVLIARAGTVKEEGQPELARVKRYSIQQFIVFAPFLVLVLSLVQEIRRRQT